jgi:hypothetical protein
MKREKMDNIKTKINELKQGRSKFQIEKFVIGSHSTPEMQYFQLLLELDSLYDTLVNTNFNIRKFEAEAEELRSTGKKSDSIEAERLDYNAQKSKDGLLGLIREIEHFESLFDRFPEYTRKQIEDSQPLYWKERLIRTAQLQALGGGVGWAQIEAVWQAGFFGELVENLSSATSVPKINYLDKQNTLALLDKNSTNLD